MTLMELKQYIRGKVKVIILISLVLAIVIAALSLWMEKKSVSKMNVQYCSISQIVVQEGLEKEDEESALIYDPEKNRNLFLSDEVMNSADRDNVVVIASKYGSCLDIYAIGSTEKQAENLGNEITKRGKAFLEENTEQQVLITRKNTKAQVCTVEIVEKTDDTGNSIDKNRVVNIVPNSEIKNSISIVNVVRNGIVGFIFSLIGLLIWIILWKLSCIIINDSKDNR